MVKQKISVTIDKETIALIESLLAEGQFRNRSHVLDYSLKKYLGSLNIEEINNKEEIKINRGEE